MKDPKLRKIFLVDDDPFSLTLYEQLLIGLGYTCVVTINSGTECLNQLSQAPEIIFLDHNMSDMNGLTTLQKIKRFNPDIYVVLVSGQEDMGVTVDALKYGAFDYIIKGNNESSRIQDVLKRIEAIQELLNNSKPTGWKKILSLI